jgi:hypothetical protein
MRLSAGGRWIRTIGPGTKEPVFLAGGELREDIGNGTNQLNLILSKPIATVLSVTNNQDLLTIFCNRV